MQETINTIQGQDGRLLVSGRSLFGCMNIDTKQNFVGFVRHRIKMLKLETPKDYLELPHWRETEKAPMLIEFRFSLESAIAVAEYSRSAKAVKYLTALKDESETSSETRLIDAVEGGLSGFKRKIGDTAVDPANFTHGPGSVIEVRNKKPLTPLQKALAEVAALAEQPEDNDYQERLTTVESKLDVILTLFKSAAEALFGLIEPAPTTSDTGEDIDLVPTRIDLRHAPIRAQIIGLVNDYVAANPNVSHHQVWRALYTKLKNEYGVDAWRNKLPKDPSYLEAIERCNQMDNMFNVAVDCLVDHKKPNSSRLAQTVNLFSTPSLATPEEVHS